MLHCNMNASSTPLQLGLEDLLGDLRYARHGPDMGRGVARIPDSLIDTAVDAAEECPGECIMIEPYDQAAIDARGA